MAERRRPIAAAPLALFVTRPEWQLRRVPLDAEHVAVLMGALDDGLVLPPSDVVELEDGSLAIVDGHHRLAAYAALRREEMPYRVVGTGEASVPWHVAHANAGNGLSRDPGAKRAAVRLALAAPEAADLSQIALARWCGVGVDLVAEVRRETLGATSRQTEAQEAAVEAAAEAEDDEPVREVAARTGASKSAIARARLSHSRVDPQVGQEREPAHTAASVDDPIEALAAPYRVLAEAVEALVSAARPHRGVLAEFDRQAWDTHTHRLGWLVTSATPTACPGTGHGAECMCRGRGWMRSDDAARAAKGER